MSKVVLIATVPQGESLASVASLRGASVKAIYVAANASASWIAFRRIEGTAAGYARGWDGAKLTAAATPGDWVEITPTDLAAADQLQPQLCSAEDGTPAIQGEAVTLTILAI